MSHDTPHLFQQVGSQWKTCQCTCTDCWEADGNGPACICLECWCRRDAPPLDRAYFKDEAPKVEHSCADCGKEVFRTNGRGRWPSRCPECKL